MRLRLSFLVAALNFLTLTAQVPTLRVKYFSSADGIRNTYVNHVTQDSTGYIWVATRDGLYKYDGYSFTGYFTKSNDSSTISGNYVNYLFVDSKDRLWIATTLGVCYYDKSTNKFVRIADQAHPAGLSSINISRIAEDNSGNILICNGNSIYRYQESSDFSLIKKVDYTMINDFIVDSNNDIWLGLEDNYGIIRVDALQKSENRIIDEISVSRIHIQGNSLWIATLGEGIKCLDLKNKSITSYKYNNSDDAMAINVCIDRQGFVWTVDYTGLKLVVPGSQTLMGYYPMIGNSSSLKNNVKGIFEDNQGNYWLYHEPGGLGISMKMKGFRNFNTDPGGMWYTSNGNITAVQEDATGNLWMGFHQGGIDVFDWQKGITRRYHYDEKNKHSLGRGSVLCIFRDHQGTIWVCTYFDGLQYFDEKTDRFFSIPHNPENPNSPSGNDIRSIAEDSEGNLWLAVHSKGVDKFDRKNNKFEHFSTKNSKLSNEWPFQLIIDKNDDLWVATTWGLNLLKKGSDQFSNFISLPDDTTSLSSDFITSLYADNDNSIWVGTSMGLNRYDRKQDRFVQYKGAFGSDFICSILSDKDNNIWISTLSGISRIRGNSINNFDVADGLASSEFNARAAYRNHKNELFFGGTKGIDIFLPEELVFNYRPPSVVITRFSIFNQEVTAENSDILDQHISATRKIRLKHSHKVISFGFTAINFINTHKNQYAYRLEGFEDNWHYVGKSREATYTNIDPGKYVFRVIACNNDGVWNSEGASLLITVVPPWYETLVFQVAALITILLVIWIIIRLRTANLEKIRLLLENTVQEKTASLVDANHELQKYNSTKDKLFSLISHDLVSPFNTIIGFSEILKEGYDHLSESEKKNYISMINESSEKVYILLNNLLIWSRSQTDRITYNPGAVRLKSLIDEVLELNSEKLKVKNISVKVECPNDLQVIADLEMLKTIIRNLISNALKFTLRSGNINISVKPDSTKVNISIIDSGIGMSSKKIDELLSESLVESENGTEGESGTGFGLSICKDFIKRNQGELKIWSEPGKGSKFTFSLPIASK